MKSKAIIIAFYSKDNLLSKDFIKMCEMLKKKHEIIISYNGRLLNKEKLGKDITFLKYNDQGYDLNCYMQGLYHVLINLKNISKCLFLNNSIAVGFFLLVLIFFKVNVLICLELLALCHNYTLSR